MARLAEAPGGPPARNAGMMARLAEGPAGGGAAQGNAGQAPPTRNPPPRHRISLSAAEASSEAMVLVSVVTEETARDDDSNDETEDLRRRCLGRVEAAAGLGFEELRRRHVEDVEGLFDRVHFSLGPSGASTSTAGRGGVVGERRLRLNGGDNGVGGGDSLSPARSCVAGLPIRTRVARSGKTCTTKGGEGAGITGHGADNGGGGGLTERTVVDDGLVELMYHYGRCLVCVCGCSFFSVVAVPRPGECTRGNMTHVVLFGLTVCGTNYTCLCCFVFSCRSFFMGRDV